MKHFNADGTMGDSFNLMCKLYPMAINSRIRIHHKTRHRFWYGHIERVYHLRMLKEDGGEPIQNVGVKFVEKHERHPDAIKLPMYPYPKFKFTHDLDRFDIPKEYCCVNLKSGRHSQKQRAIRHMVYDKIFEKHKNVIIIGDEHGPKPEKLPKGVQDLTGITHLWEAMEIVKRAKVFHGFQGLMCFVACSQKVPTYVYQRNGDDRRAIKENILQHAWKDQVQDVVEG